MIKLATEKNFFVYVREISPYGTMLTKYKVIRNRKKHNEIYVNCFKCC